MSYAIGARDGRRVSAVREEGFTLIEILIVIVILGVLAAIVVFAVQSLEGQSANAACRAEFKTVETSLEAYKSQVGAYPGTINVMTSTYTTGLQTTGPVGPWLKDTVPTNQTDDHFYWFALNSAGSIIVHGTTGTAGGAALSTGSNAACAAA